MSQATKWTLEASFKHFVIKAINKIYDSGHCRRFWYQSDDLLLYIHMYIYMCVCDLVEWSCFELAKK